MNKEDKALSQQTFLITRRKLRKILSLFLEECENGKLQRVGTTVEDQVIKWMDEKDLVQFLQPENKQAGAGVWEDFEQILFDLYTEMNLANAASKADSTVWILKDKYKTRPTLPKQMSDEEIEKLAENVRRLCVCAPKVD